MKNVLNKSLFVKLSCFLGLTIILPNDIFKSPNKRITNSFISFGESGYQPFIPSVRTTGAGGCRPNTYEEPKKMKSTGIVRKVDELGRIVLPIELRRTLDIAEKDPLEIYVDDDKIILRKYEPSCIFCGNATDVFVFKRKNICPACIKELKN